MSSDAITMLPWSWIVINSSGGKDSMAAMLHILELADQTGINRSKIVVSHQNLGASEWPGTTELVKAQAAILGLRCLESSYRDKDGEQVSLLQYARKRGKWPSSTNRWCTADFKRGPGGRVLTTLSRERPGPILHIFGFRAEESPARAKRPVLQLNARWSRSTRPVWDYLPIHDWTVEQVWTRVRHSGLPVHPAYALGMPRLSCVMCIFSPKKALLLAGYHNPEILQQYVEVEREIGHRFRQDLALADIQAELQAGFVPSGDITDKWNM